MANTPTATGYSIEELLDTVKYSNDDNYVPSVFSLHFISFLKMVTDGSGEEHSTPVLHYRMLDKMIEDDGIINIIFRGSGKCLDVNSEIMTPDGYKLLLDIEEGDTIFDRNGDTTTVTYTSPVYTDKKCYKISLTNGDSFIATYDHKHIVQRRTARVIDGAKKNIFLEEELTTDELISKGVYYPRTVNAKHPTGREAKWHIPTNSTVLQYKHKPVIVDPYTMGIMLGDGNLKSKRIFGHKDDLNEIIVYLPYDIEHTAYDKRNPNVMSIRLNIESDSLLYYTRQEDFVKAKKFIPTDYIINDYHTRLELLRGLMDSDGTVSTRGAVSFTNMSRHMCQGLLDIVVSLGGKGKITEKFVNGTPYYTAFFYMPDDMCPFRLKRKAARWNDNLRGYRNLVGIEDISEVAPIPTKCIAVSSPTESFMFDNGYVTHNTTLFAEILILYIATYNHIPGFGKINFGIYVGDTIENGVENLSKNMRYRYENSDFLQKMIPKAKFTVDEWTFENISGETVIFLGYGAQTGVRGTKRLGQRPVFAIIDDIVSDDAAKSPTMIAHIKDVVSKAFEYALHPSRRKIIWSGTPFNQNDPLYEAAESGAYVVNVFPVCEDFDETTTKDTFRGAWEDRFSYDVVHSMYDKAKRLGKLEGFYQEMMLRITNKDDLVINKNQVVVAKIDASLRARMVFFLTTDWAVSQKNTSDYSVLSVWGYVDKKWYLIDGFIGRNTIDNLIDMVFDFDTRYSFASCTFEVNGQQEGFVHFIERIQQDRHQFFHIVPVRQPRGETKFHRILSEAVPLVRRGQVIISEDIIDTPLGLEAMTELTNITYSGVKSKRDDFLDTVVALNQLKPYDLGSGSDINAQSTSHNGLSPNPMSHTNPFGSTPQNEPIDIPKDYGIGPSSSSYPYIV